MGRLIQFPWPKRESKYSLALQCEDCKNRQVVEPTEIYLYEDETGKHVPGARNVVYGQDANSCSRCGSEKMKIMNPKEWQR